jgi:hypothetical protein
VTNLSKYSPPYKAFPLRSMSKSLASHQTQFMQALPTGKWLAGSAAADAED